MILGTGVDLCDIEPIAEAMARRGDRFLVGLFTASERAAWAGRADAAAGFALHFAVKEAVAKALGAGLGAEARWTDIEVAGTGEAIEGRLSGRAEARLAALAGATGARLLISASHDGVRALATAMIVQRTGEP